MKCWGVKTIIGFGCFILVSMQCTAPDKDAPFVASFHGSVTIISKNGQKSVIENQILKVGDTLRVNDGQSNAVLKFANGAKLHLNVGTVIVLKAVQNHGKVFVLLRGECYNSQSENISGVDTIVLQTKMAEITGTESDFSVYYNDDVKELVTTVLTGEVKLDRNSMIQQITPCTRYSQVDQESGLMQPPSVGELECLKLWINASTIETVLSKIGCSLQTLSSENMPPKWVKLPEETRRTGEPYIDTIIASDPEGNSIYYRLLQGPEGMQIDESSGIINYPVTTTGTHNTIIEAIDSDSNKIQHEFSIAISEMASLRLSIPGMISINEPVSISAKVNSKEKTNAQYRFDIDGDGKFDIPENGDFGAQSTVKKYRFLKEDIYKVKAEAKFTDGTIISTTKKVIVNEPPVASLTANPSFAQIGTEITIDASGCNDSRDPLESLRMRFDMNGDGIWDIPSDAKFTKEHTFQYVFDQAGNINTIVQVYDKQGLWDTASVKVFISSGLNIKSIEGPDTVNVGELLLFVCSTENDEFPIKSYNWSLIGPEQKSISGKEKEIKLTLGKEGTYTINCTISDSKEQVAQSSKELVVMNSRTLVDAGGPYNTSVNSSLTVRGKASDKDSKITAYLWDFDGDGTADTQLTEDVQVKWIFTKSGLKKIFFSVKTEDGTITTDEASVEVQNTAPTVEAGPDILARSGRKVKLNGVAADPEKNISEYAWDFDNNGTFDWTSPDTGFVEHAFKEYSIAVFRVTDSDGALATDSLKVVVCPEGMETVENGKYCIDTYEYPNKKNEMPKLDVSYEEAVQICKDQGKRLCSAQEWENACKSDKEKWNFPYGKNYQNDKCNNMGNGFSKNKPAVSGYFQECVGSTGVFDMSGNAAEWVSIESGSTYVYGGSWQNGENGSKCNSKVLLERGKKYFYTGFRCCK